jgi:hypothetical protein
MEPLAVWNDWERALIAVAVVCALYIVAMWIAAIVWTFKDIRGRTTDGFEQAASVLLVIVFTIPGLLLYVLMRPKSTIEDRMDRRLEAEAMFQDIQERPSCPQCAARVEPDFILCPLCRAQLRTPCAECGQALAVDWVMCPYCMADRTPTPAPTRAARRRASAPAKPSAAGREVRPAFAGGRPRI